MAIGNPVSTTSSSVASKTSSVIATAGQTLFTVSGGYVTNHISVFRNGIRLVDSRDYEARNGATVTLLAAATVGDVIEFHVFDTFSVADAVTNQGGTIFGDLTVEGSIGDITANNVTGVAATFTGAVSVGGVLTYEDVTNVDSIGIMTARSGLNVTGGSLGVGLNNPTSYGNFADDFVIYNASQPGMTLASGSTSGYGSIYFADGTTGNTVSRGQIQYSHSNDFMQFSTAATERLRITSAGILQLDNGNQITAADTTTYLGLGGGNSTSNGANVFLYGGSHASNASAFVLRTNTTERLRIDSSGRLLVGTTTPGLVHGDELTLAGSGNSGLTIRSGSTTSGSIYFSDGTAEIDQYKGLIQYTHSGDYMRFLTANTERLRIDSSGRLLLGTTTEGAADADNLTIADSGDCGITIRTGTTSTGAIYFSDATSGTAEADGFIDYNQSSRYLRFGTAQGERMRIDSSGRMGLGSSSPSANLDVLVNSASDSEVRVRNSVDGLRLMMQADGTSLIRSVFNRGIIFGSGTSNSDATFAERMRIDSSGRLLVGTSSSIPVNGGGSALQVEGTTASTSRISVINRGNNTSGSGIQIAKSRGTQPALVQNNDQVGGIFFAAGDGNDFESQPAKIECYIDGAPTGSDTPGRLTFSTCPDQTDTPVERMRIDSSGRMGLGTSSPADTNGFGGTFDLSGSVGGAFYIRNQSNASHYGLFGFYDTDIYVTTHANGNIRFNAGSSGTERARIDSSGRLLVNHTADTAPAGYASKLQLCDTSYQGSSLLIRRDQNNGSAPALLFTKTRSSTKGGNTIVQNGDLTGQINFFAGDGNDASALTAYIASAVDGTPGNNDMPGRLTFHTTADGATASTERMRIDSSGNVAIGTNSALQSSGYTGVTASGSTGGIYWFAKAGAQKGYLYGADNDVTLASTDASGIIRLLTGGNNERMRISATGSLTISTYSGLGNNGSAVNVGIHQITGGKTTMSSSASWKKLFGSGHTFVGTIKLYVTSGDTLSGGGVAKEYRVFVNYGSAQITQVGTHSYGTTAGYLSNIELRYNNSGYQIQARVTWSSGSTPVVNWSAEGLASSSWAL